MLPQFGRLVSRDRASWSAAWIQVFDGRTTPLSRNIAAGTEASLTIIITGTTQSTAAVVHAARTPSCRAMTISTAVILLAPWWVTMEQATRLALLPARRGSAVATWTRATALRQPIPNVFNLQLLQLI